MTGVVITGLGIMTPDACEPAAALQPVKRPWGDWFQLGTALPGRGYKRLPPACQYLLAAARNALHDSGDALSGTDPERRAVIVGTNNAVAPLLEAMDRTIIDAGAAELSPATAPYMAMSLFASRLAMEHMVRGFNLTTNSPVTAGLEALQIGTRALAAGRAAVLLAGATEDIPPDGTFEGCGGDGGADTAADAGAAILVCEPAEAATERGARAYGTCTVQSVFVDPGSVTPAGGLDGAAEALDDAWAAAANGGTAPARVESILDGSPVAGAIGGWLAERAQGIDVETVPLATDGGCLTPLRRVVGLLAAGVSRPTCRILIAASAQGNVALARLTAFPPDHPLADGS